MKKHYFLFLLFFVLMKQVGAQTNIDTLAFQDFEITPAGPVWNFTGPVIYNSGFSAPGAAPGNSPIGIGGSRAWETTSNSGGLVLDFANTVIPSGYDSVRVRFNLAAMNLVGATGGPDDLDFVLIAYSTDGGITYNNRMRIRGAVNNNSFWAYSATGYAKNYYLPATEQVFQPLTSGLQTTLGYSTCEIVFPGTVTQISMRITGRSSASSDTWLVDNLVLTGENNCVPSTASITASACGSYTAPSGTVLTTSGTFNDTIPNIGGCDSVITINLTVNQATTATISPVVCGSYTSPSGTVYSASATFNDTIPNSAGCDSVITIALTVNQPSAASISPVVCDTYTSPSGMVYTSSATFNDTIPNGAGCDSVITITLTVNTVDVSTSLNGIVISANASGAQYQWLDCDNGYAVIAGETAQTFTPLANGNYAVAVTQNGCTDTSACVLVLSLDVASYAGQEMELLPNPTTDLLTLRTANSLTNAVIVITDIQGRILMQEANRQGNVFTFDVESLQHGVYFIRITDGDKTIQRRFVKK
jgi:hypothetical protein